ncbi:MAG: type II toxin-antitoxin system RelE/ParE family toxin [Verrucomicrobiales bacterium]|nr:type II toxin-antitoxin system RelE/ParE family toxin [Verrucomicrobiales bacterium]
MNFAVHKTSLAESDAAEAAIWYEAQTPGTGGDFLAEAEAAIASLERHALLYSVRFARVRCLRLRRFKDYGVYYVIRGNEVSVLAVLHGTREIEKLVLGRKSNG